MTKLRSVLRRWTGKFPPSKNERPEEFGSLKAHLPTVCNPTSTASDPALPVHITSHLIESMGSSKTSSTSCPRLSLKLPFNLNTGCDFSTICKGKILLTHMYMMKWMVHV